jgi:hypothetical protein
MQQAQAQYEAYRPEALRARMSAMGNAMSLFAPANGMLGQMYGPQAEIDFERAMQNPWRRPNQPPVPKFWEEIGNVLPRSSPKAATASPIAAPPPQAPSTAPAAVPPPLRFPGVTYGK